MTETPRIEMWLHSLLAGDATLAALVGSRVYGYLAPPGAVSPWVVFNYQSGNDVRGVGPTRIMVSTLYQVKGVGQVDGFGPLKPIADRIDALMQGASGVVVDGQVLLCVRQNPVAYVEVNEGRQFRHLGGLYWIIAR